MLILSSIVDVDNPSLSVGGIIALISIAMVFVILALIIFITWFVDKGFSAFRRIFKKSRKSDKNVQQKAGILEIDENDEDLMAAILVASIDYRNECHKNVKVISVKEIK